jgi:aromatic ring-opening dioxygenase LigB subunit
MSWSWAALMPHPPVLVPEVGCGRERQAQATIDGLERLMEKISPRRPDCMFILSPHQPYAPGAVFLNGAPRFRGSFAPFGASVGFEFGASPKLSALAKHLASQGVPARVGESPDLTRDQGTLVPLYFMRKEWRKNGQELPEAVLASPIGLGLQEAMRLGEAVASFEDESSWGLLASGDLSHRLTPDAPAGYSPEGKNFDAAVVAALSSSDPKELLALTPRQREEAGECGLRSVMAMLGFCRALHRTIEVISYEGPFGVGYCNAFS